MIHADEFTRKGFCEELLFNDNSVLDDFLDLLFCWFVDQVREHQAGKVTVKTLEVTEMQYIRQSQQWSREKALKSVIEWIIFEGLVELHFP